MHDNTCLKRETNKLLCNGYHEVILCVNPFMPSDVMIFTKAVFKSTTLACKTGMGVSFTGVNCLSVCLSVWMRSELSSAIVRRWHSDDDDDGLLRDDHHQQQQLMQVRPFGHDLCPNRPDYHASRPLWAVLGQGLPGSANVEPHHRITIKSIGADIC